MTGTYISNRFWRNFSIATGLLVLQFSLISARNWEAGIVAGWVFPQKDYGYYWNASPGAGFSITYPFHSRIPVTFSICGSNHTAKMPSSPAKKGYRIPTSSIAQFSFQLFACYYILTNSPFSPIPILGFENTTLITYKERLDLSKYLGETELGVHFGGGMLFRTKFGNCILSYRENLILSDPHFLWYGSLRSEFSLPLRFLKRKDAE